MARYRCYFLRSDGHAASVEEFSATDDLEAALAAGMMHRRQSHFPVAELWLGRSMLATIQRDAPYFTADGWSACRQPQGPGVAA